jgi:hypothetical protein
MVFPLTTIGKLLVLFFNKKKKNFTDLLGICVFRGANCIKNLRLRKGFESFTAQLVHSLAKKVITPVSANLQMHQLFSSLA